MHPVQVKSKKHNDKEMISLRGILLPADWDEKGDVKNLSISSFDEQEFVIEENKKSRHLISNLRKEVELTGKIISVGEQKRFRVIKLHILSIEKKI